MDFRHNSLRKSFLPGDFEVTNPLKLPKNNSQGIIFVIISCQRARAFLQCKFTSLNLIKELQCSQLKSG